MTFRADMRQAAVQLLKDYAADAGTTLQVYPARPTSLYPPTAFVDRITESIGDGTNPSGVIRRPVVDIVLLHARFDGKDAADQGDRFIDGFIDWVRVRFHAGGNNTLVALREIEDDPNYVPDWIVPPPDGRVPMFYATLIRLEGYAGS